MKQYTIKNDSDKKATTFDLSYDHRITTSDLHNLLRLKSGGSKVLRTETKKSGEGHREILLVKAIIEDTQGNKRSSRWRIYES